MNEAVQQQSTTNPTNKHVNMEPYVSLTRIPITAGERIKTSTKKIKQATEPKPSSQKVFQSQTISQSTLPSSLPLTEEEKLSLSLGYNITIPDTPQVLQNTI